ncbi:TetR/AcrR family transcriptional regulator [Rhodococcus sp. NPDC127530]|uniref:TetR/AcrR family transcriptional regulator n=1 Tax=unclassified Rhodococcus (in: high G+C Gram-positive bacteria) TaxID=192944 RepID=UPI003641F4BA
MAREQITERLVDATTKLLADKGPAEIKARSVAEAARVSTMAVYYHVGGLPELLHAVVDRGFRDLDRAFEAVRPSDDPVADLFTMALSSRRLAQQNPHLYDLVFGLSTRGSYRPLQSPTPGTNARSETFQAAFAHVVQACTRLMRSGRIHGDQDPEIVATQLWSCVHGFITLELSGHFTQFRDPVRHVLQPMTTNVLIGLGDIVELAYASHDSALAAASAVAERL